MITKRYTIVRSSLCDLYITADRDRIVRIGTERPHVSTALRNDKHPLLQRSARALMSYLSGKTTAFEYEIPVRFLPFQREVFAAVQSIPYGQTVSSDDIAETIGKPHAVRAVETVCRNNPLYIVVPCHRVLLHTDAVRPPTAPLLPDETLRRLEKRYLDKADKRG
ncbi:MAG: methylated-DNA--[protein]-cysteine S-methyltransferase [Ruminococcaceae bacterium]|nr:methylated-DNA--[protein]-cysteine S-methyltransferase [Oscillospiraceae bacterium]